MVIDIAVASGQDEREWCRANGVVINLYEKYRELLREELAVQPEPEQHTQRKAVKGKDRSRYIEITRDGRAASIEETRDFRLDASFSGKGGDDQCLRMDMEGHSSG